ncbi:glycerate kinase [Belliella kenyensis]|uniref:Glycerate kinase n=1 Tax=Belliella kenyensis TaxID=1472724 RepID=A0ABV8EMF6_9BACT|nr:glycerate kinase [Belliella kenyensis]MCH7403049.1 glycerate kinase [Belliella kenyensis]MDN3605086.1 glycerate kinase [Belliella kenyensis]
MKILIASNAFKGTITASQSCGVIDSVLSELMPKSQRTICPIADGGDGTCELLGEYLDLKRIDLMVLDAIGRSKMGFFYWDGEKKRAYIDVSSASGIGIIHTDHLNPNVASTYGTGLVILKAIESGASEIVLGLGGTASIDLGMGILHALGFAFVDENGRDLVPFSDNFLSQISHIQRPIKRFNISFICLCDVNHYFFGKNGGLRTFGPQKGLREVEFVNKEIECNNVLTLLSKKSNLKISDQAGFGAAGGIAYGLSYFFPVSIYSGASWIFDMLSLEEKVKEIDLVITGEGRYDDQSVGGKACYELLQMATKYKKKTILITSGNEGIQDGFDDLILLPQLNFNSADFRERALQNLENSLRSYFR